MEKGIIISKVLKKFATPEIVKQLDDLAKEYKKDFADKQAVVSLIEDIAESVNKIGELSGNEYFAKHQDLTKSLKELIDSTSNSYLNGFEVIPSLDTLNDKLQSHISHIEKSKK